MKRSLVAVAVAGVLLGGCGSDSAGVSDSAAAELQPRVAEIRQLAGQRQAEHLAVKLTELRSRVSDLVQRGELSERAAQEILAAVDGVNGQLALITTITTTTAPPPSPTPDDEDRAEDDEDREENEGEHRDEAGRGEGRDKKEDKEEREDD